MKAKGSDRLLSMTTTPPPDCFAALAMTRERLFSACDPGQFANRPYISLMVSYWEDSLGQDIAEGQVRKRLPTLPPRPNVPSVGSVDSVDSVETPVSGFLRVWAWLNIIGGIVGGFFVGFAMASETGYYGVEVDNAQLFVFWAGVAAAGITLGGVLFALASIVEATKSSEVISRTTLRTMEKLLKSTTEGKPESYTKV